MAIASASLADLDLEGADERLAAIDLAHQRPNGRPATEAYPPPHKSVVMNGPPSPPRTAAQRWCCCDRPATDGDARSCVRCGKTILAGATDTAGQWTPGQIGRLQRLLKVGDGASWAVGDLVLEIVPLGAHGKTTGALARLRRLADTAGAELATIRRARSVCAAWPPEHRLPAVSMSAHAVYCAGGPSRAAERRAFLLELAALHGTVSADTVRAARGVKRTRHLADPVRSLLNRVDGAYGLLEGLPDEPARNGKTSPALLARRAEQCRAIADRLDQLAA